MSALTLFEKLWNRHVIRAVSGQPTLLYVDRVLLYEVTSPQAFAGLRATRRRVWRPSAGLATSDHGVPTTTRASGIADPLARLQVETLSENCREFGITEFALHDPRQGIVHVIGPEQGATLPGMTVVCGDSHTSTHGALGALAFGVGTSDIEHVLASQCLATEPMRTMRINVSGTLPQGLYAKDVILGIIGAIGSGGATGHAIEFTGPIIGELSIEGRMTVCNMAIEAGARVGLVAVDEKTLAYVRGRPFAPQGAMLERAESYWRTLQSDVGAHFDREFDIDVSTLAPRVTWGTSPDMVIGIDECVPDPCDESDMVRRQALERALDYMDLKPRMPIRDVKVDKVFIGSCTNGRIEDLRAAAQVLHGRVIARGIRQALVVPGSGLVKAQAEAEGLHTAFTRAGFEWRESGCSMCLGMNEDRLGPGERCAATSNRNFEGRQGHGGRTHLLSPAMAAAAAVVGHFVDVRTF